MGIGGAFLTGDAFNLFVFFEVLLIASYGLMVHAGGGTRTRAGIQYVAFNLVGSSLFLFALALVYGGHRHAQHGRPRREAAHPARRRRRPVRVAAVMLILVFAIKGALVPLQFWLPGTYANAPGVVAAMFAVMTKVGAYATLRFGTLVFPASVAGDRRPSVHAPPARRPCDPRRRRDRRPWGQHPAPACGLRRHRLDGHRLHRDRGLHARRPPPRRSTTSCTPPSRPPRCSLSPTLSPAAAPMPGWTSDRPPSPSPA